MADILIGNVKGPQGVQGDPGEQGVQGEAATIEVGTVSTTAYGNPAQVTNSGTSSEAVFDFVIPAGRPGEETTSMSALTLDTITAQTATFPVPAVGERGAVVFGKIIKFFSDTVASLANKLNISDVVNNLTSTATNKPLSAAQGKALNDALGERIRTAPGTGSSAIVNMISRQADNRIIGESIALNANGVWHYYPEMIAKAITVVTANSSTITHNAGNAYCIPIATNRVLVFMELKVHTTTTRAASSGAFYLTVDGIKIRPIRPVAFLCTVNGESTHRLTGQLTSDSSGIRYITNPVQWNANTDFYVNGVFLGELYS